MGKTSLVEQFAEETGDRARVLWGSCEALFAPRPLGPFYDIVHALGGPLLVQLQADAKHIDLFGALLRSNQAGSLRDYALTLVGRGHWEPWAHLEHVIRSGASVYKRALSMDLWDYYRKHSEEGEHFARAMSYRSAKAAEPIVDACDLAGVRKIVDIGGSQGVLLNAFVEAAPQADGILFDLPHVIAQAEASMSPEYPLDRIELVGGSFFESMPAGGDHYLLKSILCDWDDTRCTQILKNIHRASAPVSRVLIPDTVVADTANASQVAPADQREACGRCDRTCRTTRGHVAGPQKKSRLRWAPVYREHLPR